MSMLLIIATAILGFYMAWTIGANDVANSMADAVGARAVSVRKAMVLAGICEFCGAVLVGAHVTETIRSGIVPPECFADMPRVLAIGMACALLGAALWLHLATWLGMPVSTTHSIVGAVAGFGIVAAGWRAVQWHTMGTIVASWFISPVAGCLVAFLLFKIIVWTILGREVPARAATRVGPFFIGGVALVVSLAIFYKGLNNLMKAGTIAWLTDRCALTLSVLMALAAVIGSYHFLVRYLSDKYRLPLPDQLEAVERVFSPLLILTSCCVAFSHGANDVANAIGPLAAVVEIVKTGTVQMSVQVPLWVLALGGLGIIAGLSTFGYRVLHTVGEKITQLTPTRGLAADFATVTVVLTCSRLKLPVSTTHTIVGAILGVGLARGLGSVNRAVTKDIFGSWLITVPAAALLGSGLFIVARFLFL